MQVITLQPLTPDLPSVDIALQSHKLQKVENGEICQGSYTAAKLHAGRTAVKALNIMQHIYSLPKVNSSQHISHHLQSHTHPPGASSEVLIPATSDNVGELYNNSWLQITHVWFSTWLESS